MRNLPIAKRLPLSILFLAGLLIAVMGGVNYWQASSAANEAIEQRLATVLEGRAGAYTDFLGALQNDLLAVASSPATQTAMQRFSKAYGFLKAKAQAKLQKAYISENPNSVGERDKLDKAKAKSKYSKQHGNMHGWYRDYVRERGYQDLYLISEAGAVVYSVFKYDDFATSLTGIDRDDLVSLIKQKLHHTI